MSKLRTFQIEVSHSSELNEQCLLAMVSAYTNGLISNNRISAAAAWYEVDLLPGGGWTVTGLPAITSNRYLTLSSIPARQSAVLL